MPLVSANSSHDGDQLNAMKRTLIVCTIWCIAVVTAAMTTAPDASAQNALRGKHVFRKCLLCHVLDPKATDHLAPPLHNVIGRQAASIKGFSYSTIMNFAGKKGFKWTREALFYFLDKPEEFMPGTYMAFAGLETQERKDVIAYLEQLTKDFAKGKIPGKQTDSRTNRPGQASRINQFSPVR